jgi:hypothetical protein
VSSTSEPIGHLTRTSRLFCSAVGIGQLVVVDAGKFGPANHQPHLPPLPASSRKVLPGHDGCTDPEEKILIW